MISSRVFRLGSRFLFYRFRKLHPFEVQASLMNACNLRCAYCRCPDIRTNSMTTQQWTDTIRRLARLGVSRIKFQGGEPTLRKDFRELTGVVQDSGVISSVTTNGQQMAESPELFDHLDEVVFSLDALDAEKNDVQRGSGVHARVMTSIDIALERGVDVYINMVVTRTTFPEIEPLLGYCEARGIGFNAQPVQPDWSYSDEEVAALMPDEEDIRSMHYQMAKWRRQGRPMMFCAETYERSARWPDFSQFQRYETERSDCMAGRYYIHIEPNGDVYPCGLNVGKTEAVNLLQDGLEAAIEAAATHNCHDCALAYLNERKALFGLKPYAIRQLLRRSRH